jgi:hypothetical protein
LQIGLVVPSLETTWEANMLECPSQRWNGRIPFAGFVRTSPSGNPVHNSPTTACRFDRGIYSAARLIKLGSGPAIAGAVRPIAGRSSPSSSATRPHSTTILIRNRPGGHRSISSVMLTEEDADISSNTVCSRNRACAFRDPRVSVPTAVDAVRVAGQCNRGNRAPQIELLKRSALCITHGTPNIGWNGGNGASQPREVYPVQTVHPMRRGLVIEKRNQNLASVAASFQRCVFNSAASRAAPVREAVISVPTRSRSRTR